MTLARWMAGPLVALAAACTTHAFAQKTPDGKIYINGASSFLFFTSSFIERCTESGTTLNCEKLTIVDAADKSAPPGDDDQPVKKTKKKKPADDDGGDDDKPKKKPKRNDDDAE